MICIDRVFGLPFFGLYTILVLTYIPEVQVEEVGLAKLVVYPFDRVWTKLNSVSITNDLLSTLVCFLVFKVFTRVQPYESVGRYSLVAGKNT